MNQLQSKAGTSERARLLLEAWKCGDPARIQHQLETVAVLTPAAGLPWMEYERWDLLSGIVQSMRSAMGRGRDLPVSCDVEVSVQLLQHLVAEAPVK
jgi:hypothetical protein